MASSIAESETGPNHRKIIVNKYSLTLIDATSLMAPIEFDIINDLYTYKLLDNLNLNKKDTKSIIYHHLILGLCNVIKSNSDTVYKVIAYDHTLSFMDEYISTQNDFILRAFRKLDNVLPVSFLELPYAFNTVSKIMEDGSGEGIELDYKLKKLTSNQKHKYTFDRIQRFSDKYGLDFLMNNFFRKVENKQLIIS